MKKVGAKASPAVLEVGLEAGQLREVRASSHGCVQHKRDRLRCHVVKEVGEVGADARRVIVRDLHHQQRKVAPTPRCRVRNCCEVATVRKLAAAPPH